MAVSAVPTTPECLSVAPKIKYAYPEFDFGLKINSERRKKSGHKKIIGPRPGAPPPTGSASDAYEKITHKYIMYKYVLMHMTKLPSIITSIYVKVNKVNMALLC